VVITGGEGFEKSCIDVLFSGGEVSWFEEERIDAPNSHGTGCTFSTSLACHLAKGCTPQEAVFAAKKFVTECLRENTGVKIGSGSGPLLHGLIKRI